jgi:hypothetical protein
LSGNPEARQNPQQDRSPRKALNADPKTLPHPGSDWKIATVKRAEIDTVTTDMSGTEMIGDEDGTIAAEEVDGTKKILTAMAPIPRRNCPPHTLKSFF